MRKHTCQSLLSCCLVTTLLSNQGLHIPYVTPLLCCPTPQADGLPSDFVGNCDVTECRSATLAANSHLVPSKPTSRGRDPLTWVPLIAAIPLLMSAALISATACYILVHTQMFSRMSGMNSKLEGPGDSQSHTVATGNAHQPISSMPKGMTWTQAGPVGEALEEKPDHRSQTSPMVFEFRDITLSVPVSSKVAQLAMSHADRLATEANTTAAAEAARMGHSEVHFQPATAATFCAITTAPPRQSNKSSLRKMSEVGLVSGSGNVGAGSQIRSSSFIGHNKEGSGLDLESAQPAATTMQKGSSYRKVLLRGVSAHAHAGEMLGLLVGGGLQIFTQGLTGFIKWCVSFEMEIAFGDHTAERSLHFLNPCHLDL